MEQQSSRELLRELEAARQRRDQEQHKLERLENRAAYLRNKERAKRTHQLCIIGGAVEHFIPATKEMDQSAVYLLFEQLSELPEVQTFLAAYKGGDPPSHSTTSM
ncbi:MAG: DUF3847 domain-containing protein [Lachnospiraceae bacterium]|nr:DUF3847 domain-containing protein [Lachnospiraceae bacterium]